MSFYSMPVIIATGTIESCRGVTSAGAAAGANAICVGFASKKSRAYDDADTNAITGEIIEFQNAPAGTVVEVEVGTGGVTAADRCIFESGGKAVTSASTGTTIQNVFGIALATYAAGVIGKFLYRPEAYRPALT